MSTKLENKDLNSNDAKPVLAEVREQIIDYIENEAEIAMPIDELTHESGRSLTKKEYGHVLLKYLVKELREHFS